MDVVDPALERNGDFSPMNKRQFSRPIRVAMVHYRDDAIGGGSLRVGETIANSVDPERVSAHFVFAYGNAGPVAQRTKLPCHFIHANGPKDFSAWTRARRLFSELQPDIIHFQDGVVWLHTALARTQGKKIVHVHGRYSVFPPPEQTRPQKLKTVFDARLLRRYLKHTDAQICINHATRNWLRELGWISDSTSCVVYNAIDPKRFNSVPSSQAARAELGLPCDALLLGIVCRLVPEKGCTDFLSIVERLPERWHGLICGNGPLQDLLQRECQQQGLADRIHFLGSIDDVAPVYAAIDAYAFVSRYDGFGLSVAEAMSSRVPVFGIEREGDYNETEYPLFLADSSWMTKCSSDSELELAIEQTAARIVQFGEQPQLFDEAIAKAQSWVTNCFAAPVQAQAMMRVYEDIHSQGTPSQDWLAQFYQRTRSAADHVIEADAQKEFVAATA